LTFYIVKFCFFALFWCTIFHAGIQKIDPGFLSHQLGCQAHQSQ
jgi:hypothetical protein